MILLLCFPFPSRGVVLYPEPLPGAEPLGRAGVWASFGGYAPDSTYAWSVRLGGWLELYRFRDGTSLSIWTSNELVASPHSPIRFQPLALFWEEGLLLSKGPWQAGFTHRCKHDVDRKERVLIYSSAYLGAAGQWGAARLHRYLILLDEPTGRANSLQWSLEAQGKARLPQGFYTSGGVKLDFFSEGVFADWRAETGWELGNEPRMAVFAEAELLHDPGIYREMGSWKIFQVGLRAVDGLVFR